MFVPTLADVLRLDPRLEPRIEVDECGCWIWTGALVRSGRRGVKAYASLKRRGKHWYGHRWTYTLIWGPIPAGHHVHHNCHTTRCVNPNHTEASEPRDHWYYHWLLDTAADD